MSSVTPTDRVLQHDDTPKHYFPVPSRPITLNQQYSIHSSENTDLPGSYPNSTGSSSHAKKGMPLLEDIVSDCFKLENNFDVEHSEVPFHGMADNREEYEARQKTATNFSNYTVKLHCNENLQFLIEIFKYEYLYNMLYPEDSSVSLNSASPSPSSSVPRHSKILKSYSRTSSKKSPRMTPSSFEESAFAIPSLDSKLNMNNSAVAEDDGTLNSISNLSISLPKVCSNDYNCDCSTDCRSRRGSKPVNNADGDDCPNMFDTNYFKYMEEEEDFNDKVDDSQSVNDDVSFSEDSDLQHHLREQWTNIIKEYVLMDSPLQINLSNKTYKKIVLENESSVRFHKPEVLLDAKKEILQLIRENVYLSFLASNSLTSSNGTASSSMASSTKTMSSTVFPELHNSKLHYCGSPHIVSGSNTPVHSPIQQALKDPHASLRSSPLSLKGDDATKKRFHLLRSGTPVRVSEARTDSPARDTSDRESRDSHTIHSSLSSFMSHLKIQTSNSSPLVSPQQSNHHQHHSHHSHSDHVHLLRGPCNVTVEADSAESPENGKKFGSKVKRWTSLGYGNNKERNGEK